MTCPACGCENPTSARFCNQCGRAVDSAQCSARSTDNLGRNDLPTSFAAGRYHLQRFLGEGAKKRVYLAHDTKLDRDVALAVIKTDGLDPIGRSRVEREAQAMARLGDHPHIVTVHDIGEQDGRLYIVSQYMAGGSVADLLHRSVESRQLRVDSSANAELESPSGDFSATQPGN